MMGRPVPPQPLLFYTRFNLEHRVPPSHPLRLVAQSIDFDFVSKKVEGRYGAVGNVSIPPPVILKLMFLLFFENVASERRLMESLPSRLDWLWFLGMDLDSEIPDHSVLSKARARWGVEAFHEFFQRVVRQCAELGLIDGRKIFCDGSLIDANASRNSIERVQVVDLGEASRELERRLTDAAADSDDDDEDGTAGRSNGTNDKGISDDEPHSTPITTNRSTTDLDAAVTSKRGAGPARARYKTHRAIDDANGVITATELTPANRSESDELMNMINQHTENTGVGVAVVVADTGYGTAENYLACDQRGITAHISSLKAVGDAKLIREGVFPNTRFEYDPQTDTCRCPAGQVLKRSQVRRDKNGIRYSASAKICGPCPLRAQCTRSTFRTITRHMQQQKLDQLYRHLRSQQAKADLTRRKHFMERSFAVGTRFGLKRCRWRRLWRAQIQDLLIATIQNIVIAIRKVGRGPLGLAKSAFEAFFTSLLSVHLLTVDRGRSL